MNCVYEKNKKIKILHYNEAKTFYKSIFTTVYDYFVRFYKYTYFNPFSFYNQGPHKREVNEYWGSGPVLLKGLCLFKFLNKFYTKKVKIFF